MLRMRQSPVSCVRIISCVLMYLLRVALVVLGGGDDPGGIAAVERDAKRAPFGFDLALEFDVRRQMVGFVFGAGFDLPRFHEHRIWCDEAHHGGGVTGGDPSVESLDDRLSHPLRSVVPALACTQEATPGRRPIRSDKPVQLS